MNYQPYVVQLEAARELLRQAHSIAEQAIQQAEAEAKKQMGSEDAYEPRSLAHELRWVRDGLANEGGNLSDMIVRLNRSIHVERE